MSLLLGLPALRAQEEEKDAKGGEKAAAKDSGGDSEDITLTTDDGVTLTASYYPGTKGKESIPVILLHGYGSGESRKVYADLAPALQRDLGCAVLVPDLRGHGDSTARKGGKIEAAKMKRGDFTAMSSQDMVAIRNFLMDENNGGGKAPRLNLNKLCIVGAGMGATVAVQFARDDWNLAPAGPWQMGTFTKAVVLLSPELTAHGLKLAEPLADPNVRKELSILLVVGKDGPLRLKDAKTVFNMLERYHLMPAADERKAKQTLYFTPLAGNLQGAKMLTEESLGVPGLIEDFITRRLIDSPDAKSYKWKRLRHDPYQAEKGE
jgi:pimeloyl-ACP methyl ester carboxylesterase